MARQILVRNINPIFIIRAEAYAAAYKRFRNPTDRELFMSGLEYGLKKYSRLINKTTNSNEKVDQ